MSSSSDESNESPKKIYENKAKVFQNVWLDNPVYKKWLTPVKGSIEKCRCSVCNTTLLCGTYELHKHAKEQKHTKKMASSVSTPSFSTIKGDFMEANCTCTLIRGPVNCIVDTMTAWDGPRIVDALKCHGLRPEDIDFVICTHGHSDHIGCNYLFHNAIHIVGHSISRGSKYFLSPDLGSGDEYRIDEQIKVVSTPGHTLQDVTVLATIKGKLYAITGDLFEKEQDLDDESIWTAAGSDDQVLQRTNRERILKIAHFIIPGHGPMFEVSSKYR